MDLAQFDTKPAANAGVDMPVRHPQTRKPLTDDDGKPITIRLIGRDSDQFQAAQREMLTRRLRNAPAASDVPDFEAAETETIDLLATSTVGWSGIKIDGKPLSFSHENAANLYRRLRWLREDVDAFVSSRDHFFPAPPMT